MVSADQGTSFAVPAAMSASDAARLSALRRMRALALSLLVVAAVVFVVSHGRGGGWGYVNAASEAAMVGGIADWFAVTALFRHPLHLPIPHTAIIPKRKQALGESLQEFVADNFLSEAVIRERIGSARVSARVGEWLAEGRHAQRLVDEGSRVAADALSYVKPGDVAALVQEAIIPRLQAEQLSPVAGELLAEVLADDAHQGLVELVLDELERWLRRNGAEVVSLVEQRAPGWTPQWVDRRVAVWVQNQAVDWVAEARSNPRHQARQALDHWLATLAQDLQHDSSTMERAERLKERVLGQPQVVQTSIQLWDALRRALIGSLTDDEGLLRRRAVEEVQVWATRLREDEELSARLDATLADAAAYVVTHYGHEIATIISATVNRWDGKETAERVELHVGRDLQFIRINGTVVGGLAGLVIYSVSQLL